MIGRHARFLDPCDHWALDKQTQYDAAIFTFRSIDKVRRRLRQLSVVGSRRTKSGQQGSAAAQLGRRDETGCDLMVDVGGNRIRIGACDNSSFSVLLIVIRRASSAHGAFVIVITANSLLRVTSASGRALLALGLH